LCKGTAARAYHVSLPRHLDTSIFSRWTQRSREGEVHCSAVTIPFSCSYPPVCGESGRPSCMMTHLARKVCREMSLHSALSHPCPIPSHSTDPNVSNHRFILEAASSTGRGPSSRLNWRDGSHLNSATCVHPHSGRWWHLRTGLLGAGDGWLEQIELDRGCAADSAQQRYSAQLIGRIP